MVLASTALLETSIGGAHSQIEPIDDWRAVLASRLLIAGFSVGAASKITHGLKIKLMSAQPRMNERPGSPSDSLSTFQTILSPARS